ncbi:MAG: P-loop NTPase [Deltaproteobacteria bacterium]|nr:P-loop NTPase [Deltaproteobacteria bacterium]MBW2200731.1 P-loop NTPase [Deltaproteobacteria bacterium]
MQKIAICGKGGSGKSVVTRLLADGLRARGNRVLVVDADESNTGLPRMLGFDHAPKPLLEFFGGKKKVVSELSALISAGATEESIQLLKKGISTKNIPPDYFVESNGIRLVEVGKILMSLEGCGCPMGIVSRSFLNMLQLAPDEVAVVDLEAGVEHFGRGVETGVDCVLVVVDPSIDSVQLADRISDMADQIQIADVWVVLNKIASKNVADRLTSRLTECGVKVIGAIPLDDEIFESCLEGQPIKGRIAAKEVDKILDFLFP